MKYLKYNIFLFIMIQFSCTNYDYDVIIKKPNGIVTKFKCKNGKDTLNSTRYDFYNSTLLAQIPYVNGDMEGTVINYYTNGNVNSIISYKNNKANGVTKKFTKNGNFLGKVLYIDDEHILFEKVETNAELPVDRKRMLNLLLTKGNQWAGEKYIVTDEEELSMGEYTGIYADIIINDTVSLFNETEVIVKFTFPKRADSSTVLIGDFDKSLNCNDTVYYNTAFTLPDSISFTITHEKLGNQYMVGYFKAPALAPETIYFFKGFYVKKENE
jgi:hypothetical protein